jgi:CheY-like chemotaxis protein
MLREVIQDMDQVFDIVEANDGIMALDALHQMQASGQLPCLIVLDINMPRMDGKQTLVALQQNSHFANIPVVVFTTSSSYLDKTFCAAKKVEMITKPFDYATLFNIAGQLLNYCKVDKG